VMTILCSKWSIQRSLNFIKRSLLWLSDPCNIDVNKY
jgi:hypothetical protein